ncbi:flagellar hook-length control protein FliK [Algibacter lectus]|uniref:Flagellar hook-length control protein FliK n=1 Tax=Algibacter lectus TaxID=221126 RepID=A0A090X5T3_9FLAO|nr:hypothetical protein [Algibacter lectus]GAL80082.1 flagellar hook-length control protein FliK [Algibacter lectus]
MDNYSALGNRGTFSLCIEDKVGFDYKEGAIEVPHTGNWCSSDAEYTTDNGSPDGPKGSAWSSDPNANVWFKFKATTTQINAEVKHGGVLGDIRYPLLALWDTSGLEINSTNFNYTGNINNIQSNNLTIGDWYYVSVDNYSASSNRGNFTFCLDDKVNFDYKEGAIEIPHIGNWCSADAEYTTVNASPDRAKGSAWSSEPSANVWFKFQATTTQINTEVKYGGTLGDGRYPLLALWDASGTEINSTNFNYTGDYVNVQSPNLTIGNWYFISVDTYGSTGHRGSFTLCVDDKVNFDYKEGAIEVPHTADWCSVDAEYSTVHASPDGVKGSAWANGPNFNVWFKFKATSTQVNAEVKKDGTSGDMRYSYVALWEEDGTEITSKNYNNALNTRNVQSNNLTIGNWYYISVDNHSSTNYTGSFTLCVDDEVNFDYKEGAIEVPHTTSWCSGDDEYNTYNASPDGTKGSNWFDGPNFNVWFKFQPRQLK